MLFSLPGFPGAAFQVHTDDFARASFAAASFSGRAFTDLFVKDFRAIDRDRPGVDGEDQQRTTGQLYIVLH